MQDLLARRRALEPPGSNVDRTCNLHDMAATNDRPLNTDLAKDLAYV